jgi:hypothetical protein
MLFQKGKAIYKLKADRDKETLFFYLMGINKEEQVLFLTYRSILEKYAREFPRKISMEHLPEGDFDYPVIMQLELKQHL